MLSLNSPSKSGGTGGKVISQPLRKPELFGIPKGTVKKGLQPQLMKDILGPVEWEKVRRHVNNPRRTIMPDTFNSTRKKLDETAKHQISPIACGDKTNGSSYLFGLSKSEGKINAKGLDRPRMQPENVKHSMECWEKEQAERAAHSTKKVGVRNETVRRKLYNHLAPSPKPVAKANPVARRSEIKSQKTSKVDVKNAPSGTAPSRRSRLVQPNSIRDKYVHQQDPITEESTLSIDNASINGPTIENGQELDSHDEKTERMSEQGENNKDRQMQNDPIGNDEKLEELPNSPIPNITPPAKSAKNKERTIQSVIVRPSVIMGVSAIELRKEQSPKSNENEQVDSDVPSKELKKNMTLRDGKLNGVGKSLDDNLDTISQCFSCAFCHNNLPRNSFTKSTLPTPNPCDHGNSQSVAWIHATLKHQVESMEQELSFKKLLLKTFEDLMKGHEKGLFQETKPPTSSHDLLAGPIDNSESNVIGENVISKKGRESESEIRIEVSHSSPPNDVNNQESSSMPQNTDDHDKENKVSVEKPRRRSARIAAKFSESPESLTDSFSSIERQLNIVHDEKKNKTPAKTKSGGKVDPRCRRSVREYMALKSSMNFLATPDLSGAQAAIEDKRTPSRVRSVRRDLSRKLLNELEDLYAESPI